MGDGPKGGWYNNVSANKGLNETNSCRADKYVADELPARDRECFINTGSQMRRGGATSAQHHFVERGDVTLRVTRTKRLNRSVARRIEGAYNILAIRQHMLIAPVEHGDDDRP